MGFVQSSQHKFMAKQIPTSYVGIKIIKTAAECSRLEGLNAKLKKKMKNLWNAYHHKMIKIIKIKFIRKSNE